MRQLVTGIGIVTPVGIGPDRYWSSVLSGRSGIDRIQRFDPSPYSCRLAGEVRDFVDTEHIPSRLLPQTDRMTRLALAAADWAIEDAGVRVAEMPEYGVGVVTANASGGFEFTQNEAQKLWSDGPHRVSAYQSFAWFYAANTGQISIRTGGKGSSAVVVTGQAGGLDAIGHARRQLRGGGADIVLTGGVEAPLSPYGLVSHLSTGELSEVGDPGLAYLPFDGDANGYVPGEGGAILVLENEDSADLRGVEQRYGAVIGYGASFDPSPDLARPSTMDKAIRAALADAGVEPSEVDVVFADGAATPAGDSVESCAIAEVFGPNGVPVTVPKTMTGRLLAGAASVDVVAALLAIRDGVIPPTVNTTRVAARHKMDLVLGAPRKALLRNALVLARGRGGFNSALVLTSAQ